MRITVHKSTASSIFPCICTSFLVSIADRHRMLHASDSNIIMIVSQSNIMLVSQSNIMLVPQSNMMLVSV